jgi:hypothetical protein
MDTTASRELERLERAYRDRVQEVRAAPLSWEKKERMIRQLGLKYDAERRKLQSGRERERLEGRR